MRKITESTARAFIARQNKTQGNTTVMHNDRDGITAMYLHGNLIAVWRYNGSFKTTLAGWNTPTTRERLNGLIRLMHEAGHIDSAAYYSQHKFSPHFTTPTAGMQEIYSHDWQTHETKKGKNDAEE